MFISNAYAAGATTGGDLMSFLPLVVIFVLFFFMIIRPQMKAAKAQREMITALQKGDEVVTSGGIVGKVTKVTESFVSLEIAVNPSESAAALNTQKLINFPEMPTSSARNADKVAIVPGQPRI